MHTLTFHCHSSHQGASTQQSYYHNSPFPTQKDGLQLQVQEHKRLDDSKHSLHSDLHLLCSQIDYPLHSLHPDLILLC